MDAIIQKVCEGDLSTLQGVTVPTGSSALPSYMVDAWNQTLEDFIQQLIVAFPDEAIRAGIFLRLLHTFTQSEDADRRALPLELFHANVEPHHAALKARDDGFISQWCERIPVLKMVDISRYWNDALPAENRDAIWAFLERLWDHAAMVKAIPPEASGIISAITASPDIMNAAMEMASRQMNENPQALEGMFEFASRVLGMSLPRQ